MPWVRAQVLLTDSFGNSTGYLDIDIPDISLNFDRHSEITKVTGDTLVITPRPHPEVTIQGRLRESRIPLDGS